MNTESTPTPKYSEGELIVIKSVEEMNASDKSAALALCDEDKAKIAGNQFAISSVINSPYVYAVYEIAQWGHNVFRVPEYYIAGPYETEKPMEPTIPEVITECYHLRTFSGDYLGQVVLTSDGAFMSITEWGDFNFAWRSYKTLPDFKKFLAGLDVDYFSNKMYQGVSYQFSGRKVQDSCYRFAKRVLPALKKVLQAELDRQQP